MPRVAVPDRTENCLRHAGRCRLRGRPATGERLSHPHLRQRYPPGNLAAVTASSQAHSVEHLARNCGVVPSSPPSAPGASADLLAIFGPLRPLLVDGCDPILSIGRK